MTSKVENQWFENYLKNAQLIGSRCGKSSSTKKNNPLHKQPLTKYKTGDKFRLKVAKLSLAKKWSQIKEEWIVVKPVDLFKQSNQCLCGRGNLKFVTYLKNIKTQAEITAGNHCLLTLKRSI
ncbi:unnamed protein product [Adineta steineri]|uniref:Uncharacterized protein n=1 Tax=Adineta steineri TaxID=433720 RepID=A0A814B8X0_9BILA|nr:unnamed protein product [Adineta steineri]CAF0923722.1 unnamed protein product [Adineta steineri]